jgi:hypothetical protein
VVWLKIVATKTKFDYFGRFSFAISIGDGIDMETDMLVKQAINFSRVIVYAHKESEPEMKSIQEFAKKMKTSNPQTAITVYTKGMSIPVHSDNVRYVVALVMKSSGIEYSDRIISKNINAHNQHSSLFFFFVDDEDSMDEIMMIATEYQIPKNNIYLCFETEGLIAYRYAKHFGMNLLRLVSFNKEDDEDAERSN